MGLTFALSELLTNYVNDIGDITPQVNVTERIYGAAIFSIGAGVWLARNESNQVSWLYLIFFAGVIEEDNHKF